MRDKRFFVLLVATKLLLSLQKGTAVQQLHTPCFVSIDQLIALMPASLLTRSRDVRKNTPWMQKWGQKRTRRGMARHLRPKERRSYNSYLSYIIIGNIQLLANKTDELTMLAWSQREF